ncbi:IclR family transcriptional regulator [Phenylobacterium aquaticum]|uniref:IclR family transcriptional regulator n=1 Tax=Phenylobacterium aquaticum TaxID=1763816 RepID=UPI001F5DDE05|nr:helix-turn-helix domain-containing protein [Phenylobacterium aquaticum]MCI3131925.1 helix-turn-helix domain-containing protein [Phenylobacterium aquaticum]
MPTASLHVLRPEPPAKPVGAVTAAVSILRCLGGSAEPLRLSDITRALGLNSSTALNILRTLEFEGLVGFDRASKRYALARGLADLAAPVADRDDPGRRLTRLMDATAHELGATVALWTVVGEEVELTAVAESSAVMRIAFTVGRRLPMFLGAMGRLVAGRMEMSDAERLRLFAAVPWTHPPAYADWLAEVAAAREAGAALDKGHVNPGVLGVAVPVEIDGPLRRIVAAAMFETPDAPSQPARIIERLRLIAALA